MTETIIEQSSNKYDVSGSSQAVNEVPLDCNWRQELALMSEEAQDALCDTPHIIRETLHEETGESPVCNGDQSPEVLGSRDQRRERN
jgi:hypothetical protein